MCSCYEAVQIDTGQRAVMLCCWEGNRGPADRNTACCRVYYDQSPAGRFRLLRTGISSATRHTSMGLPFLFHGTSTEMTTKKCILGSRFAAGIATRERAGMDTEKCGKIPTQDCIFSHESRRLCCVKCEAIGAVTIQSCESGLGPRNLWLHVLAL